MGRRPALRVRCVVAKLDDGGGRRRFPPVKAPADRPIHNRQPGEGSGYLVCRKAVDPDKHWRGSPHRVYRRRRRVLRVPGDPKWQKQHANALST